jgi:SAM-dependent methyltransferase
MDNIKSSTINEWEQRYQQGKTGWDRGKISPNLTYWLENKKIQPCRILVPGCGNGYEVLHLAEKGFDVIAIDIAPTAVTNLNKMLAENQLHANVIQADFFNWNPEQAVDAIYEQTSLCALSLDLWVAYEHCLYQWLKPNGKLLAQFMQTGSKEGPPFHCDISTMLDLFSITRWKWSKEQYTEAIHSGEKHERVYFLEKN